MTTRADIVATARTCLDVPFRHQGRSAKHGLDCVGLVLFTMKTLGLSDYDYTAYSMTPPADLMTQVMREKLQVIPLSEAGPGDILRFHVNGDPIHVGIATDIGVIHAVQVRNKVVEHRLDAAWRARIVEAYRVPGVSL